MQTEERGPGGTQPCPRLAVGLWPPEQRGHQCLLLKPRPRCPLRPAGPAPLATCRPSPAAGASPRRLPPGRPFFTEGDAPRDLGSHCACSSVTGALSAGSLCPRVPPRPGRGSLRWPRIFAFSARGRRAHRGRSRGSWVQRGTGTGRCSEHHPSTTLGYAFYLILP